MYSGKRQEEDILFEFVDTFEHHHMSARDPQISIPEWMAYWNNVSMTIDDDLYFKVMMTNAWGLDEGQLRTLQMRK